MIGHWIAFVLIFILIPFGLSGFVAFLKEQTNFVPTEEHNKIAKIMMAKYTMFYWLCDIFYLVCFNNWLVMKFIVGLLIMTIIFYNLTISFLHSSSKNVLLKFGIIQDFIVGIGLSVYLIYIIPNQEIKEIIIPIVSAVYGGLLTLVGVAWTIKWTKKESVLEYKNKIRPFIYPCLESINGKTICKKYFGKYGAKNELVLKFIKNSDKIEFVIRSIILNNIEYPCVYGQGVSKNEIIGLIIESDDIIPICDYAILKTEDEDGNECLFQLDISENEDVSIKITNIEYLRSNDKISMKIRN